MRLFFRAYIVCVCACMCVHLCVSTRRCGRKKVICGNRFSLCLYIGSKIRSLGLVVASTFTLLGLLYFDTGSCVAQVASNLQYKEG